MKRFFRAAILSVTMSVIAPLSVAGTALTIGGKGFTENILAATITAHYLKVKGYDVDLKTGMGSSLLRSALVNGQVDLYWEYTGPALTNYFKHPGIAPDKMLSELNSLDRTNGLTWLDSSNVNDTYAFAMNRDVAEKLNLKTLDDLARYINSKQDLEFACNAEFYSRLDGLKPLEQKYGFAFSRDSIIRMDSGLTYSALKDRKVQIALVFTTDGRIPAYNFILLEDNRNYFISQVMTPVIRNEKLKSSPELAGLLKNISSRLDNNTMRALNAEVDVQNKTVDNVADEFLQANKLK